MQKIVFDVESVEAATHCLSYLVGNQPILVTIYIPMYETKYDFKKCLKRWKWHDWVHEDIYFWENRTFRNYIKQLLCKLMNF